MTVKTQTRAQYPDFTTKENCTMDEAIAIYKAFRNDTNYIEFLLDTHGNNELMREFEDRAKAYRATVYSDYNV